MSPRHEVPTMYWQAIVARNLVVLQQGGDVAFVWQYRANALASKCEYPTFRYPPFKCPLFWLALTCTQEHRHSKKSMHSEFTICSESLHFVLTYYILSSESLCARIKNASQLSRDHDNTLTFPRGLALVGQVSGHHSLFSVHNPFPQVFYWESFTGFFCNENAEFTESLLGSSWTKKSPDLPFLAFSKKVRKTTQKSKDFFTMPNP